MGIQLIKVIKFLISDNAFGNQFGRRGASQNTRFASFWKKEKRLRYDFLNTTDTIYIHVQFKMSYI